MTRFDPAGIPGTRDIAIPEEERQRVRWRGLDGTTERRRLFAGQLWAVLLRLDGDRGALVEAHPDDLIHLGDAVPRIPPVPAGACAVLPFAPRSRVPRAHEAAATPGGAA